MTAHIVRPRGNVLAKDHCPSCGSSLAVTERLQDRTVLRCAKCNAEVTVADGAKVNRKPQYRPQGKGPIILRDRSKERKQEPKKPQVGPNQRSQTTALGTLPVVREAMKSKKLLSFMYLDAKGRRTLRTVEPYKLLVRGGKVVLFAYCTDHEGIRAFNLDSVVGCQAEQFTYEPKWPIEDTLVKPS